MLLVAGACAFLLGHVRVVLHSISPAFRVGQTSVVTTSAVHYGHIEQPQVSSLRTWHFRARGVMGILTLLPCVPLALLLGSREAPKVIWIDPGLWIHGRIVRHVAAVSQAKTTGLRVTTLLLPSLLPSSGRIRWNLAGNCLCSDGDLFPHGQKTHRFLAT
jgi:hypothetical protein